MARSRSSGTSAGVSAGITPAGQELETAGYSAKITGKPVCCGLTWISTGQLNGARRQLRRSPQASTVRVPTGQGPLLDMFTICPVP